MRKNKSVRPSPSGLNGGTFALLLFLLLSNTVLSFSSLGLFPKSALLLLGVLLPCALIFRSLLKGAGDLQDLLTKEFLPPIPPLLWIAVCGLGLFLRFDQLVSLSAWPLGDEGWANYYSWGLTRHWNWTLLAGEYETPTADFWGQALFFKFFGPSLFSLWLFPACLSILALFLSYAAFRQFFSKSFSFLCFTLGALNYWHLYSGRASQPAATLLPMEYLALLALGWLLKSDSPGKARFRALVLGITAGSGFYTSTLWIPCGAFLTLVLAWGSYRKKYTPGVLACYLGGLLPVIAPMALEALHRGFGLYIGQLLSLKGSSSGAWEAPLCNLLSLFWTADSLGVPNSLWNPLLSSLFFLGLILASRYPKGATVQCLLAACVFFAIPGLLSNTIESFRVIPLLPVMIVLLALALRWVTRTLDRRQGIRLIASVLVLSGLLDSYHLFVTYHRGLAIPGPSCSRYKTIELWRAYDVLKATQAEKGPGLILSEFRLKNFDHSLAIATCPFNTGADPNGSSTQPTWLAILVNAHLRPDLARRFPKSQWVWLSEHMPLVYGGLTLGIISFEKKDEASIQKWKEANDFLEWTALEILYEKTGKDEKMAGKLQGSYRLFEGDPFLESVYWQKLTYALKTAGRTEEALQAAKNMVERGSPNAFAYNQLGELSLLTGDKIGAEKAFRKALSYEFNLTIAAENLRGLREGKSAR